MNTQPSLFDIPAVGAARRADPETSKEAAQSVTATALESLVMHWLRKRPSGLTTHELAEITGLSLFLSLRALRHLCAKDWSRIQESERWDHQAEIQPFGS